MKNRYLYFTVFVSGMATLAIELSASRLMGAVFGTSNLVWASIIGLILIYLTVGYFLGGRWADRSPYPKAMYTLLAWGGFSAGLVPLVAKPVLPFAAEAFDQLNFGVLAGSFLGVLILFSIPVTLLGTISPFAIRLALKVPEEAGTVAGRVYAISTIGSFLGTFLPVLFLIPLFGTTNTFLIFSIGLVFVALIGLWRVTGFWIVFRMLWMPLVLLLLGLFWADNPLKRTQGQIFETESAYNYIEVLEIDQYVMLRLNDGQGIHSIYHPEELMFFGPWMQFLVAPFYNLDYSPEQIERIAILGLAAGTTVRQATEVFGPLDIDGYEIDPEIIDVGRRYFGMNQPGLNAIAQDGRWGLLKSSYRYNIIVVDAYRPPYIPWHMTTKEFFQVARDHLVEDGALALNVGRAPDDQRLLGGLVSTLESIFPSVYVMDIPDTFNSVVYATNKPTVKENMVNNFERLASREDIHPLLIEAMGRAIAYERPAPQAGNVFSDDRAPVEWITNSMVLGFVFSGGADTLR